MRGKGASTTKFETGDPVRIFFPTNNMANNNVNTRHTLDFKLNIISYGDHVQICT